MHFVNFSGARVLGTLQACIPEGSFGHLDGMVHLVLHGKSYFHLQNPSRPVSTFVLCNRTESSLDELKVKILCFILPFCFYYLL